MLIENISRYNFEDTLKLFEEGLLKRGWSTLHIHNLHEILKNKGYEVLPVKVYEVCKASYSVKLLQNSNTRHISCMMPCRVSIYLSDDGEVRISRMDAKSMSGNMEGLAQEMMGLSFSEMEDLIAPLVK